MTSEQEPELASQSSEQQELVHPKRDAKEPMGHGGLLVGVAIGFAVWLPFMLFSGQFLSQAIGTLVGSVVVGLLLCTAGVLLLFVLRRQVVSKIFGDVQLSTSKALEAASEAVDAWPDRERASKAAKIAFREALAIGSWALARRALLTLVLTMAGSLIALLGTVLMLKQTEALEEQNKKLDAQTDLLGRQTKALEEQNKKLDTQTALLDRQTKVMADEGKWELLWNAHSNVDPATRLSSVVELSTRYGVILSGVKLEGAQPPTFIRRFLDYEGEMLQLSDAFHAMQLLPDSIIPFLADSRLFQFRIHISRIPNRDIGNLFVDNSEVAIGNVPFVTACTFRQCLLKPQGKDTTFRDCKFDKCLVDHTPMGSGWLFQESELGSLAIKSTGSRDPRRIAIETGTGVGFAREGYPIFVENCRCGLVHVSGVSLVGFRNCHIDSLSLAGDFQESALPILLNELIASDCRVKKLTVGMVIEEDSGGKYFKENPDLTRAAMEWVRKHLR